MQCPDCGGPCWDNREGKKNPKSPDWKCKDKACGKGVWLNDKKKPVQADVAMPPRDDTPDYLRDQQADEEAFVKRVAKASQTDALEDILALHSRCFAHALALALQAAKVGIEVDTSALAAQAMIALSKEVIP